MPGLGHPADMVGGDPVDPSIHLLARKMDHPKSGLPDFRSFKRASRINPTCVVKPAGDELGSARSLARSRCHHRFETARLAGESLPRNFAVDSCNENLREERIHRNYARSPGGMPRRVFRCADARVRPRAAGFSCLQKNRKIQERTQPMKVPAHLEPPRPWQNNRW